MSLAVGDVAPSFALSNQFGKVVSLEELTAERAALLVFYPFAFSGVCTGELEEIRDDLARFQSEHVTTVAISCDPMFTLRAWDDREAFFFPLLSDFWPHGEVARAYGVFDEQGAPLGMFSKQFGASLLRSTWNLHAPGLEAVGRERGDV